MKTGVVTMTMRIQNAEVIENAEVIDTGMNEEIEDIGMNVTVTMKTGIIGDTEVINIAVVDTEMIAMRMNAAVVEGSAAVVGSELGSSRYM